MSNNIKTLREYNKEKSKQRIPKPKYLAYCVRICCLAWGVK